MHDRRAGFTLVEVMIGCVLGSMVLTGVIATFLFLLRSGAALSQYGDLQIDTRRALEEVGEDLRMAVDVHWNNESSVTLTVPDNYTANGNQVTYAYNSGTVGPTAQSFYRKPGNDSAGTTKTILAHHVAQFTLRRFDRLGVEADTDAETKCVGLTMRLERSIATVVTPTESIVSAMFLIRNKPTN